MQMNKIIGQWVNEVNEDITSALIIKMQEALKTWVWLI